MTELSTGILNLFWKVFCRWRVLSKEHLKIRIISSKMSKLL